MIELKFRNVVTLLVIGGLIGGAGIVISYDGLQNQQVIVSEVTDADGAITKTFKDNSLGESQIFNIWLGAILGYGGGIISVLYKASKATGED